MKRPETFDFLGFAHYWGRSRKARPLVCRKTAKDPFRRALKRVAEWPARPRAPLRLRYLPRLHETYKDAAGEHLFRLKAANGEKALKSKGYKAKTGVQNGNAAEKRRRPRPTSSPTSSSRPATTTSSAPGETYSSTAARDGDIEAVKRTAPTTDLTRLI
ncbi:MAG: DUF1508 domain-containing protein [Nannocystales bacterium]